MVNVDRVTAASAGMATSECTFPVSPVDAVAMAHDGMVIAGPETGETGRMFLQMGPSLGHLGSDSHGKEKVLA
jgi:hypothetical protein